jgi:ribosomal protein S18 acetylase RimI-like enzyme
MLEVRLICEKIERNPKRAFLLSGAFGPYTIGHEHAARQAAHYASKTGHTHLYHGIGASAETEDAPLTHAQKTKVIKASHRLIKKDVKGIKYGVLSREHDNPFKQVLHLAKTGHTHVTLGLGSDQMKKTGLRGSLERHVAQHGGMKDKEGNVHPVKLAFKQIGKKRDERPLHRTELVSRLNKGDLTVAKAGHLRKAVRSGDTELAHALMPASVNKPKYFNLIKKQQKKIQKKKLTEGLLSFSQFIAEAPELDPYIEPGETEKERFNVSYLKKKKETYAGFRGHGPQEERKFVGHKRMGDIHPDYELWRHTTKMTDRKGNPHHQHQFSIVHKKTREKVGEIDAQGGRINRITGEHTPNTKGKGLRIQYVGIHPDHSASKIGTSLAVAAYKHLHSKGHSIKSDKLQSYGGASVWDKLRKDKDVGHHVMYHDERDVKPIPAHTLSHGAIWQEHPSAQETTLVLHAKPKQRKKAVSEDIELIPVDQSTRAKNKPRKAADVHKGYATKDYSNEKIVTKKNLGEIHPGYDLHHHSRISKDHRGRDVLRHQFTIVHRASGDVAGEMNARGGKLHPIKGVVPGPKGKGLKVTHLEVHPDHSSKKVGKSLAVEMYRHLHRRGHAIQSDAIQSHGAAHVWNTMRHDPELKKHMMIHSNREPLRGELHTFEKRANRRPERHIWYQHSRNWSAGREKVEGSSGDEPDEVKTLVLSGKKRRKQVKEDIEMADVLTKPHGGYHRDFAKMVATKGINPKKSGRIAKGYTLYTSVDKNSPNIEDHHIVHDETGHVAGEISTRTSGNDHTVIHTDIHGDHTQKKIGKSLAVLAYKHLARKKGNLHSSSLQSPGGASIWQRIRKDPRMKGQVFHKMRGSAEVPAHDLPDKKVWATEVAGGISSKNKNIPKPLPPSRHHAAEHGNVMGSRLIIRPAKKS